MDEEDYEEFGRSTVFLTIRAWSRGIRNRTNLKRLGVFLELLVYDSETEVDFISLLEVCGCVSREIGLRRMKRHTLVHLEDAGKRFFGVL